MTFGLQARDLNSILKKRPAKAEGQEASEQT